MKVTTKKIAVHLGFPPPSTRITLLLVKRLDVRTHLPCIRYVHPSLGDWLGNHRCQFVTHTAPSISYPDLHLVSDTACWNCLPTNPTRDTRQVLRLPKGFSCPPHYNIIVFTALYSINIRNSILKVTRNKGTCLIYYYAILAIPGEETITMHFALGAP